MDKRAMGYEAADELYSALLRKANEVASSDTDEPTQIAYPEDRYGISCIGCGIETHLQMVPHRDTSNLLVGWVFVCETCRPSIVGRYAWFSEGPLEFGEIGTLADTADNYLATLELPMSDAMKLDSLKTGMAELSRRLKALYVECSGENPWEGCDVPD